MTLAPALGDLVERCAAPSSVAALLERLIEEDPGIAARLTDGDDATPLAHALVTVSAASNAMARLCAVEPAALDVLDALDTAVPTGFGDAGNLVRVKRLELLRIAARDLLGLEPLESVGAALAALAERVLQGAVALAELSGTFSVIGMGKLGGDELNYASDVDVVFVSEPGADDRGARNVLEIAGRAFRVDADLRPEGRAGPLTRTLEGYRAYWGRWASAWEFQALLKARAVAGDAELGILFQRAAEEQVWSRAFSADELAEMRAMKARAERMVASRGFEGREIKRGAGGIRDIEFAVQLLQLVHGRVDPGIRERSTLGALRQLSVAGYVAAEDATALTDAYRFLRTLEHRLQLVEEEQVHAVPVEPSARRRIAMVMGFRDDAGASATTHFDETLRRCQRDVRAIHERLFFRPLLEEFSVVPATEETETPTMSMSSEDVALRLAAFGFRDEARTRAAVQELAGGLTRRSRLMAQLLPLLLDWLSLTPDPDLGLLGLRNLVMNSHTRALLVATFRESPEAARRICLLLGSSRTLAEALAHNPELIATTSDDRALAPTWRDALVAEAAERMRRDDDASWRRSQLVRMRQDQLVRIAARDLLDLDAVGAIGRALTGLNEALVEAALGALEPPMPFTVVGLGRFGGAEMAYASDLDVVLVYEDAAPADGEAVAEALVQLVHGPAPAGRVATLDLGLRPEGAKGRLARDLHGYESYFARWAQTWERQALLRARVVAGDRALGERFMSLVSRFVWERPVTDDDVAAIRRMKARMERERIPAREDPQFHLKLGRGSLSDVEWTVQLLQLLQRVPGTGTLATRGELASRGALAAGDAHALEEAYVFCEHTRNRWHLVGALPGGATPGDALPSDAPALSRLARSLSTTPTRLRDDYRRVTRRARRVVERAFYGIRG